jgi:hypothetical protein
VPHVTNISFSSGFEALPRPRCAAVPVAVAPWALTDVSVAAVTVAARRHVPPASAVDAMGVDVAASTGTRPSVGPRLAMPTQQIVRNPLIRKHNHYQTRVNAGGDGASGPYPEREPA